MVSKQDAIDVNDQRYDIGVLASVNRVDMPGFYNIPILRTDDCSSEGIIRIASDALSDSGAKRVLLHTRLKEYPLLFNRSVDAGTGCVAAVAEDYFTATVRELLDDGDEGVVLVREFESLVDRVMRHS